MQPRYEVAQVLERNTDQLHKLTHNSWQLRTLHALRRCRTAALGGHIDQCDHPGCGKLHLSYNSCRNRHCPKCQGHKREQWIQAREAELLNVPYFHVVFTLPQELNKLALYTPKHLYSTLFATAWEVISGFGHNHKFLGAQTGMIAILHTWGQNLSLHPHLHCIVPGGGMTKSGKWKQTKNKSKFLFPVKAMSRVFRAKMVAALRKQPIEPYSFYEQLFAKEWVVYCKQPFYGPKQVVEYLGRYTHKIAISNHRLKSLEKGVSFSMKDYRHGGKKTTLTLGDKEFIRRFALHILPKGFVRIRHYGILSSCRKKHILPGLQQLLGSPKLPAQEQSKHRRCPVCKKGTFITIVAFDSRGPPNNWRDKIKHTALVKTTPEKA